MEFTKRHRGDFVALLNCHCEATATSTVIANPAQAGCGDLGMSAAVRATGRRWDCLVVRFGELLAMTGCWKAETGFVTVVDRPIL